nr:single-stranded DNA-binding protein [uncultured Leptotrichia sp.]
MNNIVLIGRMTKDPELKYTNNGKGNTRFTLAVQRNKDETDFINCVAWEKTAENIAEYFKKGSQIAVQGTIRTGNYEKDGRTIYTTDVWVYKFNFIGNSNSSNNQNKKEEDENFPF